MANAYRAYFDASYNTPPHATHFVAGFVSTERLWLHFEHEWPAFLQRYDLTPPFHMNKFAVGAPPYDQWRANHPAQEKEFLAEAVRIIQEHIKQGFVCGVALEELEQVRHAYTLPPLLEAPPYVFCGVGAIRLLYKWGDGLGIERKNIECIFESGDLSWPLLEESVSNAWGAILLRRAKEQCVPLQTADFLAWEMRRALVDQRKGKVRLRGLSYEMFNRFSLDGWLGLWDKEGLERICKRLGQPKESG